MAIVEIDEANGAGETLTHSITNTNMGSTDAANLVAATYPITPATRSYIKYQKFHVTDLEGASKVFTLKVWRTGALSGSDTHVTNARTASYAGALAYATPTQSAVATVDQTMPTSEPGSANLGIGGSLTGEITVPGSSDYLGHQLVVDSGTTAGASTTQNYKFTVVA